jgi:hypothetical protein
MSTHVFRGVPRIVALTLVFLFAAGFAALGAVLSKDGGGVTVFLWGLSGLLLLLGLRFPFTRAVATRDGLKLHNAIGSTTIGWSEISSISAAKTEQEGAFINVKAPVLHLANGKKVAVTPASSYSGDTAARTAAELERLRLQFTR